MTRDDKAIIIEAITFAMKEISYSHRDVLIEGAKQHPQQENWAHAYSKLFAARKLVLATKTKGEIHMTDTNHSPSRASLNAALAILQITVNPLKHHDGRNVTAGHLAEIIDRETSMAFLVATIDETMEEIAHSHCDMLAEQERNHPRGSGWARVYDKLQSARGLLKGRAA
jgi:hypothetical protein